MSPREINKSDEETSLVSLSPMEANQQPKMVKTEADIVNEKGEEQAEHANQNIIDTLDNLDIAEQGQPSAIESFLQEEVRTYLYQGRE